MGTILNIEEHHLNDPEIVRALHTHPDSHWFWSGSWSPDFYSRLAYEGLISITHRLDDGTILLAPEMQRVYALLDWENLHISRQVRKLLRRVGEGEFKLTVTADLDRVIDGVTSYHSPCWLTAGYADILRDLSLDREGRQCHVMAAELSESSGRLIAGELGYRIGAVYTSLTGFIDRSIGISGCGTLQMVLLARRLQEEGYAFWNLGHANMEYKNRLGAVNLPREEFLERWKAERDRPLRPALINGTAMGAGELSTVQEEDPGSHL